MFCLQFKIPGGIPRQLLPVMKNMILAKTYACFAHVIQQEVGKTIGWEQVYGFVDMSDRWIGMWMSWQVSLCEKKGIMLENIILK